MIPEGVRKDVSHIEGIMAPSQDSIAKLVASVPDHVEGTKNALNLLRLDASESDQRLKARDIAVQHDLAMVTGVLQDVKDHVTGLVVDLSGPKDRPTHLFEPIKGLLGAVKRTDIDADKIRGDLCQGDGLRDLLKPLMDDIQRGLRTQD